MAILNFQKPDKVIMIDSTESHGKFEFRPLEPGYGLTIGNALRRVLLSSLEVYAFTSIKIGRIMIVHVSGKFISNCSKVCFIPSLPPAK